MSSSSTAEPLPANPDGTRIPSALLCPITHEPMLVPVIDPDGNTYERSAIESWLENSLTSPITRRPLKPSMLVPNRALEELAGLCLTREELDRMHRFMCLRKSIRDLDSDAQARRDELGLLTDLEHDPNARIREYYYQDAWRRLATGTGAPDTNFLLHLTIQNCLRSRNGIPPYSLGDSAIAGMDGRVPTAEAAAPPAATGALL